MAETADPLPAPTYISTAANEDDDDDDGDDDDEEEEEEEEDKYQELHSREVVRPSW